MFEKARTVLRSSEETYIMESDTYRATFNIVCHNYRTWGHYTLTQLYVKPKGFYWYSIIQNEEEARELGWMDVPSEDEEEEAKVNERLHEIIMGILHDYSNAILKEEKETE